MDRCGDIFFPSIAYSSLPLFRLEFFHVGLEALGFHHTLKANECRPTVTLLPFVDCKTWIGLCIAFQCGKICSIPGKKNILMKTGFSIWSKLVHGFQLV